MNNREGENMFNTIKENVSAEIVEKKSKFIANLFYVETIEDVENRLKEIRKKYYDAKHNCFAFRLDNEKMARFSDDGEPSGTAGAPMLNILEGRNLSNVLVIVTRYFGGILLGTGGLVRAYSEATLKAIENSEIVEKVYGNVLNIEIEYKDLDNIKYYLKNENINIENINYGEKILLKIELTDEELEKIKRMVDDRKLNINKIELISKEYILK